MSEHRPITDGDLIAQLRRRSSGGGVSSSLPVGDFIVDVGTKIDTGTAPVPTRRWPAFAGLAGAAAILFVLVVALPRLGPGGPSPSPTLLATLPSTISFMSVREFAARVAAGELRGETVLVNARIVPNPALFLRPCPPPGPCYLGDLKGTDPTVSVSSRWFPTMAGQGTELAGPGINPVWGWWHRPETPLEGVMVLAVDLNGNVMFMGRNPPEEIASVLSEIQYVDFDRMPLEEIRVVPAWLAGSNAAVSCLTPGPEWRGLPGRFCGDLSWLASDPRATTMPAGALQVQNGAYNQFAPSPSIVGGIVEPRAGLYVIAKRLEGSGCPNGLPPCWQWDIVGRVTINGDASNAEPFATPTPAAAREIACTPLESRNAPNIVDQVGIVASCELFELQEPQPFPDPIFVRNAGGDDHLLEVHWSGSICDLETTFTFSLIAQQAELVGVPSSRPCEAMLMAHHLRIVLTAPVLAETVTALLATPNGPPAVTPIPATPTVSPQPVAPIHCPTAVRVPMADEPTWWVLMHDETGLIESCTIGSTLARVGDPPIVVTNTDGTSLRLLVEWEESPCIDETPFQFRRLGDGYELIVERPSVTCAMPFERRAIYFDVRQPLLAGSISASVRVIESEPVPTPNIAPTPDVAPPPADTVFECTQPKGEVGAVVIDSFGLVDSCATVEATGEGVAESAVVRNPDGKLTELQIEWPGTPCDAAVAYTVMPGATGISIETGPRPDGRTLSEEGMCIQPYVIHAIRLQLSSGIDARNVWISSTAVPTTTIQTFGCEGSDVSFHDSTGSVVSCRSVAIAAEPTDGNPLITNPGGDTSRLGVFWAFQDPSGCGPQPPAIALTFTEMTDALGFVVSTAVDYVPGTGCLDVARWFGLEIELSAPIRASDVAFASSGRGAVDAAKTHVGIFDLVISADELESSAGEPVQIEALLQYNAAQSSVELWGVDSLVNGFGIKQLDGPLVMGPSWDEPCVRHELEEGQTLLVPYEKSAAWSEADPNAAFYRDWVQGEELLLPAGTWLVTAYSEFAIGSDCAGPLVSLQASQVIVVR